MNDLETVEKAIRAVMGRSKVAYLEHLDLIRGECARNGLFLHSADGPEIQNTLFNMGYTICFWLQRERFGNTTEDDREMAYTVAVAALAALDTGTTQEVAIVNATKATGIVDHLSDRLFLKLMDDLKLELIQRTPVDVFDHCRINRT